MKELASIWLYVSQSDQKCQFQMLLNQYSIFLYGSAADERLALAT